jgi:phosphoribosylformylglycinamidine (FGAM) synthase-like enzyme
MCIAGRLGADVAVSGSGRADVALFGESAARIVVEVSVSDRERMEESARLRDVSYSVLGSVTEDERLSIALRLARRDGTPDATQVGISVSALKSRWEEAIPWAMR